MYRRMYIYRADDNISILSCPSWVVNLRLAEEHGEDKVRDMLLPNPSVTVATARFDGTFSGGLVFILGMPKEVPLRLRFIHLPPPNTDIWSCTSTPDLASISAKLSSLITTGGFQDSES